MSVRVWPVPPTQKHGGVVSMAADWAKIEAEYITTDTSYRKLADKYNVSERKVYGLIKRFGKDCTLRAV